MIVYRKAAGAGTDRRKVAAALYAAGLLTTLAACAGGNTAEPVATPTAASGPAAAAPAAATTAAAPKAAPHPLSPTQINEQCCINPEATKRKDLDDKARYVDKCVGEKMKSQGM